MFTDWAILFGMVYVYLPLMVLPLYASMEKLDFRLVEAGYDLYADRFQVLRRIIIPLVKPGIIAGSILVFIPSLGAYVTPRVLGGGKNMMLGNLIELQFGAGPQLAARRGPLDHADGRRHGRAAGLCAQRVARGESGMAERLSSVRRQPGFATVAMFSFFLLYLPIADARRLCLQRRRLDRRLGGLLAALVRRSLEQRRRCRTPRSARCSIAVCAATAVDRRGDHGGARHDTHRALSAASPSNTPSSTSR